MLPQNLDYTKTHHNNIASIYLINSKLNAPSPPVWMNEKKNRHNNIRQIIIVTLPPNVGLIFRSRPTARVFILNWNLNLKQQRKYVQINKDSVCEEIVSLTPHHHQVFLTDAYFFFFLFGVAFLEYHTHIVSRFIYIKYVFTSCIFLSFNDYIAAVVVLHIT